jgi:hypothetical protein
MLPRIISAAAFALIASALVVPSAAEAGSRWRFLNPGYYFYDPPPRDFYADEYGDEEYYEDDEPPLAYYEPDEDYYEPRYEGEEPVYIAPKKKKKTVKAAPAAKPVIKKPTTSAEKKAVTSKSVASVEKKSVASVEKKVVTSTEKKTAIAATGMSCDKAEKIVSGYGFSSVKSTTCTGPVFSFNATRSGKSYVIKLSSASGELTEVKKVQ